MTIWLNCVQFGGGALILIGSLIAWIAALDRWQRGLPLVAWQPRRPVPWRLLDVLVIAVMGMMVVTAGQALVAHRHGIALNRLEIEQLSPQVRLDILSFFSISSLLVMVLAAAYLRLIRHAEFFDIGWSWRGGMRDVAIGIMGFLMLIVPMLLIHALARWLLGSQETHPFIDIILQAPRLQYLIPIGFAAMIVAPLSEEFLFRGVLQGWLERCFIPLDERGMPVPIEANGDDRPVGNFRFWMPITISAGVFAAAHLGQGPAPIPLFFLAIGLGYLFQRTHRLTPGIVVHFLVNALAVGQLAIEILRLQANSV